MFYSRYIKKQTLVTLYVLLTCCMLYMLSFVGSVVDRSAERRGKNIMVYGDKTLGKYYKECLHVTACNNWWMQWLVNVIIGRDPDIAEWNCTFACVHCRYFTI